MTASGYINTVYLLLYSGFYHLLPIAIHKSLPVTTTEGPGNRVGRLLCLSVTPGLRTEVSDPPCHLMWGPSDVSVRLRMKVPWRHSHWPEEQGKTGDVRYTFGVLFLGPHVTTAFGDKLLTLHWCGGDPGS